MSRARDFASIASTVSVDANGSASLPGGAEFEDISVIHLNGNATPVGGGNSGAEVVQWQTIQKLRGNDIVQLDGTSFYTSFLTAGAYFIFLQTSVFGAYPEVYRIQNEISTDNGSSFTRISPNNAIGDPQTTIATGSNTTYIYRTESCYVNVTDYTNTKIRQMDDGPPSQIVSGTYQHQTTSSDFTLNSNLGTSTIFSMFGKKNELPASATGGHGSFLLIFKIG